MKCLKTLFRPEIRIMPSFTHLDVMCDGVHRVTIGQSFYDEYHELTIAKLLHHGLYWHMVEIRNPALAKIVHNGVYIGER